MMLVLTPKMGVNYFNDGIAVHKETYYNLNMSRVVKTAQERGLNGFYWERWDGAKMYGAHIIVAANQKYHPYGSVVMTSLGTGIVLDTGDFAKTNPEQYDIAVTW